MNRVKDGDGDGDGDSHLNAQGGGCEVLCAVDPWAEAVEELAQCFALPPIIPVNPIHQAKDFKFKVISIRCTM